MFALKWCMRRLPVWNFKCESCRGKCNVIHNGKQFKDTRYWLGKGKCFTEDLQFGGSAFSVILFSPWVLFYIIEFWTPFLIVDIPLVYAQSMSMMTAGYFFSTQILIMSRFMVRIWFSQGMFSHPEDNKCWADPVIVLSYVSFGLLFS